MRPLNTVALMFIICLEVTAQIQFEKGFIIDNEGKRTECLIRNPAWQNNPVQFEYKFSENEGVLTASLQSVSEFGIYGSSKYTRAVVKIDKSPQEANNLTSERNPVWSEEEVFLKSLVEGHGSLYFYRDGNLFKFFYRLGKDSISQLIYKKYTFTDKQTYYNQTKISENADFRQQLFRDVKCGNTTTATLGNLQYKQKELVKHFVSYNACSGSESLVSTDEVGKKNHAFHLKIAPGLTFNDLSVRHDLSKQFNAEFKGDFGFRVGIDAEFTLPYNRNKWAIVAEPAYQHFNSANNTGFGNVTLQYSWIEFPVGLRHFFFLREGAGIFVDALLISNFGVTLNAVMDYDNFDEINPRSNGSFAIGGGAWFRKLSAEIRYSSNRVDVSSYRYYTSSGSRISLIIGYRLF